MTGYQAKRFLENLGDGWLKRNRPDLNKHDFVDTLIASMKQPLGSILEIGCSNGWRLEKLKSNYDCQVTGIDPSDMAIKECQNKRIKAHVATADHLPFFNDSFDIVIIGFCLSVIDPEDYFRVAAESSRVLKDGGTIIIWDHVMPRPFKVIVNGINEDDIFYHFYDWPKLWLAHPGFQATSEIYDSQRGRLATALVKNFATSFPIAEYKGDNL